jgi:hypothetical protein
MFVANVRPRNPHQMCNRGRGKIIIIQCKAAHSSIVAFPRTSACSSKAYMSELAVKIGAFLERKNKRIVPADHISIAAWYVRCRWYESTK